MSRILAIDDEPAAISLYRRALESEGHEIASAETGKKGLELAREGGLDAILLDFQLPDAEGIDLIAELCLVAPVVMVTSHGGASRAVRAIREGAYDFIEKPFSIDVLRVSVANAISFGRLAKREAYHRARAFDDRYLGEKSVDPFGYLPPPVADVLRKSAPTRATILLTGETGVGKEHAAARIHHASGRSKAVFVALNCAAIPSTLAESELFGHEKGAFTGALTAVAGKFELADGGTLFLDEVGELPLDLQPKLLRAVQEGEVTRIGARAPRKVDVRILAATNRDLETEIAAGRFRQDLFFRLNVMSVDLPPLRNTPDAIPALAETFLRRACGQLRKRIEGFTPDALAALHAHKWPGNVRELANTVERAAILEDGVRIKTESLGLRTSRASAQAGPDAEAGDPLDFRLARENHERRYFQRLMEAAKGSQSEAARLSGIHRNNIHAHLVRLALL